MQLIEFIERYCDNSYRGYVEQVFDMKEGIEHGAPIPDGFVLINEICIYPEYAIFINEKERAVLKFDFKEFSLSIYDNYVVWVEVIKKHKEFFLKAYSNLKP